MTADPTVSLSSTTDIAGLKRTFSCFPSGVVAVCATAADGSPVGMAASSFTTVSLAPPLASVSLQNTSTTWRDLRESPALGISVLAHGHDEFCRQLSGPRDGRFTGVEPMVADDGALLIPGAAAHLVCRIHQEVPAGDHVLVLLHIEALTGDPTVEPLIFHAGNFSLPSARRTVT